MNFEEAVRANRDDVKASDPDIIAAREPLEEPHPDMTGTGKLNGLQEDRMPRAPRLEELQALVEWLHETGAPGPTYGDGHEEKAEPIATGHAWLTTYRNEVYGEQATADEAGQDEGPGTPLPKAQDEVRLEDIVDAVGEET